MAQRNHVDRVASRDFFNSHTIIASGADHVLTHGDIGPQRNHVDRFVLRDFANSHTIIANSHTIIASGDIGPQRCHADDVLLRNIATFYTSMGRRVSMMFFAHDQGGHFRLTPSGHGRNHCDGANLDVAPRIEESKTEDSEDPDMPALADSSDSDTDEEERKTADC